MSGNEKLKQANAYQRAGSLLFNLSLAIAIGALGYLLVRWALPDLLPGEALSDDELRRYGMIVFLTALPLNLISYIPLNRAKRLYAEHDSNRARDAFASGENPEKFNYEAFVENRASQQTHDEPEVKIVYEPEEVLVPEVPAEIADAVKEPRKEFEFTAPPARALGAQEYLTLTAPSSVTQEIDDLVKTETSEAQARLEALKARLNKVS